MTGTLLMPTERIHAIASLTGVASSTVISGEPSGGRSFLTKEEKLAMLKEYKEDLEKEVAGVEERIKELSSK